MLWYLVVFIASVLVSAAVTPKPEKPKPSGLNDIQVPTAEPGRAIPIIFGTVLIKDPNTVWYGDLSTRPIRSSGK